VRLETMCQHRRWAILRQAVALLVTLLVHRLELRKEALDQTVKWRLSGVPGTTCLPKPLPVRARAQTGRRRQVDAAGLLGPAGHNLTSLRRQRTPWRRSSNCASASFCGEVRATGTDQGRALTPKGRRRREKRRSHQPCPTARSLVAHWPSGSFLDPLPHQPPDGLHGTKTRSPPS
jgi:hypothetical protein